LRDAARNGSAGRGGSTAQVLLALAAPGAGIELPSITRTTPGCLPKMNEVLINATALSRPMNERGQLSESSHLPRMRADRPDPSLLRNAVLARPA
jgi:hypothetical protein